MNNFSKITVTQFGGAFTHNNRINSTNFSVVCLCQSLPLIMAQTNHAKVGQVMLGVMCLGLVSLYRELNKSEK